MRAVIRRAPELLHQLGLTRPRERPENPLEKDLTQLALLADPGAESQHLSSRKRSSFRFEFEFSSNRSVTCPKPATLHFLMRLFYDM